MMRLLSFTFLVLATQSLGVLKQNEQSADMSTINVDIDWSGLLNNMQQPQPEYGVMTEQMPMPQPMPMPEQMLMSQPMPTPQVAVSDFMQVSSSTDIQISGINTVADLIARSWANTWSMMSQDPNSSISLIYAGYKPLGGSPGMHWRLVFKLSGFNNTEFVALDIAVLENGSIDIFRTISTRNLTDINLLFGLTIDSSMEIAVQWLKESFLYNSPMVLNKDYDAAQASMTGFDINWTMVQSVEEVRNVGLDNLMMNLGGEVQQEPEVVQDDVFIGSGLGNSLGY